MSSSVKVSEAGPGGLLSASDPPPGAPATAEEKGGPEDSGGVDERGGGAEYRGDGGVEDLGGGVEDRSGVEDRGADTGEGRGLADPEKVTAAGEASAAGNGLAGGGEGAGVLLELLLGGGEGDSKLGRPGLPVGWEKRMGPCSGGMHHDQGLHSVCANWKCSLPADSLRPECC